MKIKEYLNEGVKFFKASVKIGQLINLIIPMAQKEEDIKDIIPKLENIKKQFEDLENAYAVDKNKKFKQEHKKLESKYFDFLSIISKEKIKQKLKKIGLLGSALGVAALSYGVITSGLGVELEGLLKTANATDAANLMQQLNAAKEIGGVVGGVVGGGIKLAVDSANSLFDKITSKAKKIDKARDISYRTEFILKKIGEI